MKMDHLEWVIAVVVAGLIGIGSAALFGGGLVSLGVALGVLGVLMWVGKLSEDEDNKKFAESQRQICAERMLRYDAMVDQGTKVFYNDKPWKKGCRIDPATGAMIEPGV